MKIKLTTAVLCGVFGSIPWVHGHDAPLHAQMSYYAAYHSEGLRNFLETNFGPGRADYALTPIFPTYVGIFNSHISKANAYGWIREGAVRADDDPRYKNHFYDPIHNLALTDNSESPIFYPVDSFTWASVRGGGGTIITNSDTWQNARDYEYQALTAQTKDARDKSFSHMFESVGQVVHLLQDLSQPGHVRNDNHYKKRYIENYGTKYYSSALPTEADVPALDWSSAGFTKLRDFWDRELYTGVSSAPLNSDGGTSTLGLAEYTNGNFLSEDSLYGDTMIIPAIHIFPYPSLYGGTNYYSVFSAPAGSTTTVILPDQTSARRLIIAKVADGVPVAHHSALSYLGYRTFAYYGSVPAFGISVNDDSVLQDYHLNVLPKAVAYSGGLIDYFFRGRTEVRVTWDKDQNLYRLSIKNVSPQTFVGGSFNLYWDDANGNRAPLALTMSSGWSNSSTLASGSTIEGTFQIPNGNVKGFTMVYKGTIGSADGGAADPIDAGIAMASYQFQILRFNITWSPESDIDLYLVDPTGQVTWYSSKVSDLGELDNDNIGGRGPENITVKQVVDGDYQVWVNYFRDWYDDNPNDSYPAPDDPDKTPVAVTLNTYYNSSSSLDTNSFTLTNPNQAAERPVGVSGPSAQASWYVRKILTVKDGKVTVH